MADETATTTHASKDDAGPDAGKAVAQGSEADAETAGKDAGDKDAGGKDGKAIWMGSAAVGIGSAALVAALLYARRRK
ncbi:MAG TPA: hypothetical protein VNS79_15175 [Sphingobium sp.]|nr:hypothetical protein [Sphingobium sp.]